MPRFRNAPSTRVGVRDGRIAPSAVSRRLSRVRAKSTCVHSLSEDGFCLPFSPSLLYVYRVECPFVCGVQVAARPGTDSSQSESQDRSRLAKKDFLVL